ncbi:hypothetical protein JFL43_11025 [Viridibacillus sp. YIM B01967]|uniref:Short-chain dehydrogenase n=1 Tax=Viridibacillus soli TaxID=2798301 RepID=A0ABS1H7J2_9BACL|nr:hypothetical protein [Viridibacillus soli]MBK3495370.1 hypothetical protein [Viridibacillus soli]
MDLWTWPLMATILLICSIGYVVTRHVMKIEEQRVSENDLPVSQAVKDNPMILNPIVWAYGIAFIFVFILIAYYVIQYQA